MLRRLFTVRQDQLVLNGLGKRAPLEGPSRVMGERDLGVVGKIKGRIFVCCMIMLLLILHSQGRLSSVELKDWRYEGGLSIAAM